GDVHVWRSRRDQVRLHPLPERGLPAARGGDAAAAAGAGRGGGGGRRGDRGSCGGGGRRGGRRRGRHRVHLRAVARRSAGPVAASPRGHAGVRHAGGGQGQQIGRAHV